MTQAAAALNPIATPEATLHGMLDLILRLKDVYKREVDAMESRDTAAFLAIQPDKERLSREYEIRTREIQAKSEKIKLADPALRAKIIVEQEYLNALAERAEELAVRMAEIMRRLNERLIDAARYAIKQDKIRYAENGQMTESLVGRPIATAINETA